MLKGDENTLVCLRAGVEAGDDAAEPQLGKWDGGELSSTVTVPIWRIGRIRKRRRAGLRVGANMTLGSARIAPWHNIPLRFREK